MWMTRQDAEPCCCCRRRLSCHCPPPSSPSFSFKSILPSFCVDFLWLHVMSACRRFVSNTTSCHTHGSLASLIISLNLVVHLLLLFLWLSLYLPSSFPSSLFAFFISFSSSIPFFYHHLILYIVFIPRLFSFLLFLSIKGWNDRPIKSSNQ